MATGSELQSPTPPALDAAAASAGFRVVALLPGCPYARLWTL